MADHLQDPHNFGAICRTAEAFGIHHLYLLPKNRAVQITPSVVKASSGAVEAITFYKLTNLNQALTKLSSEGYWIYGASSNLGQPIEHVTFNFPMVLICGSEDNGISTGLMKSIHDVVHIPLMGQTSSLNVSVATGIILQDCLPKSKKKRFIYGIINSASHLLLFLFITIFMTFSSMFIGIELVKRHFDSLLFKKAQEQFIPIKTQLTHLAIDSFCQTNNPLRCC